MTLFVIALVALIAGHTRPTVEPARAHHHHGRRHHHRRHRLRLLGPVVASWYYDQGDTACGYHAHYGIANLSLACGTKVILRHDGHRVVATVDDRGPYVAGRTFDLDVATRDATACPDLCDVRYRVTR
jgi:hypothetical protein